MKFCVVLVEEIFLGKKARKKRRGMWCSNCGNKFEEYGCSVTRVQAIRWKGGGIFFIPGDVEACAIISTLTVAKHVRFPKESRRVFTGLEHGVE